MMERGEDRDAAAEDMNVDRSEEDSLGLAPFLVEAQAEEGVEPPLPLARLEEVVRFVLGEEGVGAAELSVTLLDDSGIERLNRDYLQHEGPTDVISFPLAGPGPVVVGDIYIGVAQAARQAQELGISVADELLRLAVHGTLHVLGHEHPEDETRESAPMYRRQEELLERFRAGRGH
jgi:probable rRNA maturation factor